MQDKPRYSRISDILDLAIFMSSKIQGVTITEIAERYNVSRRTAERMRDSLTSHLHEPFVYHLLFHIYIIHHIYVKMWHK